MTYPQLTPFETALLSAVEELNSTFEAGLKTTSISPSEFENLHRAFNRFATDLEKRLHALERQQAELRRLLETG